nr:hypothetical protein [Brevibacillus laterosporus]
MKKYLTIITTGSLVLFTLFTVANNNNSENHVVYSSVKAYVDNPQG